MSKEVDCPSCQGSGGHPVRETDGSIKILPCGQCGGRGKVPAT